MARPAKCPRRGCKSKKFKVLSHRVNPRNLGDIIQFQCKECGKKFTRRYPMR